MHIYREKNSTIMGSSLVKFVLTLFEICDEKFIFTNKNYMSVIKRV